MDFFSKCDQIHSFLRKTQPTKQMLNSFSILHVNFQRCMNTGTTKFGQAHNNKVY